MHYTEHKPRNKKQERPGNKPLQSSNMTDSTSQSQLLKPNHALQQSSQMTTLSSFPRRPRRSMPQIFRVSYGPVYENQFFWLLSLWLEVHSHIPKYLTFPCIAWWCSLQWSPLTTITTYHCHHSLLSLLSPLTTITTVTTVTTITTVLPVIFLYAAGNQKQPPVWETARHILWTF